MATEKQISANRRNAKHSTGPNTEEGKRQVARNAMTHGLLSRQVLPDGEDPDVFAEVREQLWGELQPQGELETYLAGRVIAGIWRMNRAARIEAGLFNSPRFRPLLDEEGIGGVFRSDCAHGANAFCKLFRYETTIDRGIHRALHALRKVRAVRRDWEDAMECDWEGPASYEAKFPFEPNRASAPESGGAAGDSPGSVFIIG
jgi:hypothetical protein